MPLFGPPDVRSLRAKRDVNGLCKALGYQGRAPKTEAARVRWEAAQSLGAIADVRAVGPLIAVLDDQDKDVREASIQALGKIGDTRAVEPLIVALKDQDRGVRIASVQALGKIGDVRAVDPLITALDHDPHDWVRMVAADALESLGVPGMQGRAQSRRLLAELREQED